MGENRFDKEPLDIEIVQRVESDLRKYPDWILRMDAGGLGNPHRYEIIGVKSPTNRRYSSVEDEVEHSDETQRKVRTIEAFFDRLRGVSKDIIELRYFQDYPRDEVLDELKISKREYYNKRNRVLESFARALGYIE